MSDEPSAPLPAWITRFLPWIGLALPSLVTLVYFVWLAGRPALWQQSAYGIGKLIQFSIPIFWVSFIQRQPVRLQRCAVRNLVEGGILGAGILLGMALLYLFWLRTGGFPPAALQAVRHKMIGLGVFSPGRFVALAIFYALGHSLLEEYYWRWFIFRQWRERTGFKLAALISALGFTAHHVIVLAAYFGGWSLQSLLFVTFFSLCVTVGGLLWAWLYERQQTLYGVWLSHLLVDAGIFAVGYDLVLR